MNFSDTKVTFLGKSNAELRRLKVLFTILGSRVSLKIGKAGLAILDRLGIKPNIFVAPIFNHFCGGEDIESCKKTINGLWDKKVGTILDFSVEGSNESHNCQRTCDEIIASIAYAANTAEIPFAVFKLTGLLPKSILEKCNKELNTDTLSEKEKEEFTKFKSRLYSIGEAAEKHNVAIFIDAEESWYQDAIDTLALELMFKHNTKKSIVYNTVQLYRHDRLDYIRSAHDYCRDNQVKIGFKLVRGAYMEKERRQAQLKGLVSPINPTKEATDALFNEATIYCLDRLEDISICLGTHNEESCLKLVEEIEKRNIAKDNPGIYFAQLLGMSDNISFNLSAAGFNCAKYVPYGPVKEVVPYLIRRAEENTSVAGQTSRELNLIQREIERRKKAKE